MMTILNILGILCLGYYLFLQLFRVDFALVWLAAGAVFVAVPVGNRWLTAHEVIFPIFLKEILLVIVLFGVCLFLFLEGLIFIGMKDKGRADLDYVIVLGAQVKGDRPSRSLKKRIDKAYEYLSLNPDTKAILSGGQGPGESMTEAECMYEELVGMGIAPRRLLREEASTDTRENLIFSARMVSVKESSVGLVTQNFHVYRSLKLAKKQGYQDVTGIAASAEWIYQPHFLVREAFALVKEKVKGNI